MYNNAHEPSMSTKDDDEKSDHFYKRPGTTDVGKDYEDIRITQIAITLLGREDVADFHIWSNDANYGSFDDVIVIVESKNGNTTKVAIQLKHAASNKIVTRDSIASNKGDFSLLKYFNDYQRAVEKKPHLSDYIFLLQTNKKISNKDIQLGDLTIQPEEVDDPVESLLSDSSNTPKPLKFTVETSGRSDEYFTVRQLTVKEVLVDVKYRREEFEKFLQKLYFYPQQPNVEETRRLCVESFKKKFLCDKAKPFIDFVQTWSKQDGLKPKLTKGSLFAKVCECLLSLYIYVDYEMKPENVDLFLNVILQFGVTLISEEDAKNLDFIWNEAADVKDNGVTRSGQKDLSKFLWHLVGSRLIIVPLRENNAAIISKALTLRQTCGKKQFIFVTNGQDPKVPANDIFQNFNDLKRKDATLFESVGETLEISLNGKEAVPLKEYLGDEEVRMRLTSSHFLRLLEGPLSIGQIQDKLPNYQNRSITDYSIDFNYVNNMDSYKNVALICSNVDVTQIKGQFPNVSEWTNSSKDESKHLFFCNISQTEAVFNEICNRMKSKKCVCLEYSEEKPAFQWLRSSAIDPELHHYRQPPIPEEAIQTEDYLLNIICNNPGTGKTWFMKRLALNCYPSKILIYIEPKNHSFFDKQQTSEEYENFLLTATFKEKNALELAIFKYLLLKKQILILWDGLDEACQDKLPNVLNAIDYFKNIGLSQWIASRVHLQEMLEDRFNCLSRKIATLEKDQQEDYIELRLFRHDENRIEIIMNHLRPSYVYELFGIPLHLFMLTELFNYSGSNLSEQLTSAHFSIVALYQHFLDKKFKFHEEERKSLDENFEKAAFHQISILQSKGDMKPVDLPDEFFEDIEASIKETRDKYKIITSVNKNSNAKFNFVHHTFAEFLAAKYCTKNYHNLDKIQEFLAHGSANYVRFFFDAMIAEDSELHLAVLYKDVENVKQLINTRPKKKDKLGRNPLTLAACWAEYSAVKYQLAADISDQNWFIALPLSSPNKDEMFTILKEHYELDEKNKFVLSVMRFASVSNSPILQRTVSKAVFAKLPGTSYVESDGRETKLLAVSNSNHLFFL